jgi:hypothetical protein
MKRVIFFVMVCAAIYFATHKILLVRQTKPAIAKSNVHAPTVVLPPQPQPLVTSLPPLTNLAFRAHRILAPSNKGQPMIKEVQIQLQEKASPASKSTSSGKSPRQDLMARAALALVGIDSEAERYWAMAINDPSLSESEREDLIEDLNEEGFEDPKNPTLDELPIIVNRLQIIEEYAPSAMDEVNARSFAEAYKDLVNMYVRVTGQAPQ